MKVSFIIPTYNEEENITLVLDSIEKQMVKIPSVKYEIIIADNYSSDNTAALARDRVDVLLFVDNQHPSGVRNEGAKAAEGDVYVFLDGDVILTGDWGKEFTKQYNTIKNTSIITGSVAGVPDTTNWIINNWFKPIVDKKRNYINTGHLIVSRKMFETLNGFNETLETGEDTDFSLRASKLGAKIINNPKLSVVHLGFPSTLRTFFKREMWHGKSNWTKELIMSKMTIFTMLFWVGLIGSIFNIILLIIPFGLSLLMGLKRSGEIKDLPSRVFLSSIILLSRGLALVNKYL